MTGSVGSGPHRAREFAQLGREIFSFAREGGWEISFSREGGREGGEERKKTILYAPPGMVDQMVGIFQFIADSSQDPLVTDMVQNHLFIADAAVLLMNLTRVAGDPTPLPLCTDRMMSAQYSYTLGKE